MLLGAWEDNEGLDIHYLFAGTDIKQVDRHSGMVDKLGQAKLEDLSKNNSLSLGPGYISVHVAFLQHLDANDHYSSVLQWRHASAAPEQLYDLGQSNVICQTLHLFHSPYLTISFSSWPR